MNSRSSSSHRANDGVARMTTASLWRGERNRRLLKLWRPSDSGGQKLLRHAKTSHSLCSDQQRSEKLQHDNGKAYHPTGVICIDNALPRIAPICKRRRPNRCRIDTPRTPRLDPEAVAHVTKRSQWPGLLVEKAGLAVQHIVSKPSNLLTHLVVVCYSASCGPIPMAVQASWVVEWRSRFYLPLTQDFADIT